MGLGMYQFMKNNLDAIKEACENCQIDAVATDKYFKHTIEDKDNILKLGYAPIKSYEKAQELLALQGALDVKKLAQENIITIGTEAGKPNQISEHVMT